VTCSAIAPHVCDGVESFNGPMRVAELAEVHGGHYARRQAMTRQISYSVIPIPRVWHDNTMRHIMTIAPCPIVSCLVMPCSTVSIPMLCREVWLAIYARSCRENLPTTAVSFLTVPCGKGLIVDWMDRPCLVPKNFQDS